MISKDDVKYIADLARLQLSDQEIDAYAHQLAHILDYVNQLNTVGTEGVEPTCLVVAGHNPLREDQPAPSLPREDLLGNGPRVQGAFFAVPKVIEQ